MEKLRPMTAKEKLCHVSNQMFVFLMVCKHLLHTIAVTQPMYYHLPCGHGDPLIQQKLLVSRITFLTQTSKTNSISHF